MTPAEIEGVEAVLGERVLSWRELAGGYSHETCALELERGPVVVRLGGRTPAVEAEVMRQAGAKVPVPGVRRVHESSGGARSFMVIDHVEGVPLAAVLSSEESTARLESLGRVVADVLLQIGAVGAFERPGFFADSELRVPPERPWSRQLPEFAAGCMEATPEVRLDRHEHRAWADLCAAHAPSLAEIYDLARLVHSDYNPKNILVRSTTNGWQVAAVLDWEFAYAGCPYADAGNMLRHADDYPLAFVDGFRAGYAAGTPAGIDWEYFGAVIDMFALSELVTRPVGHPVADLAARRIRALLDRGVCRSTEARHQ